MLALQARGNELALVAVHGFTQVADGFKRRCIDRFGSRSRLVAGQGQVIGGQGQDARAFGAGCQGFQRGAADQVFQFPYVAGPIVAEQGCLGVLAEAQAAQAKSGAILFEEEAR
ncbi:hypothetical protein D3C80_1881050 [compost metagenome]